MAPTIEAVYTAPTPDSNSATASVDITTPIPEGAVLLVIETVVSSTADILAHSATGMGATWTRYPTDGSGVVLQAWIGTGAVGTGTITVTGDSSSWRRQIRALVITGVSGTVTQVAQAATTSTVALPTPPAIGSLVVAAGFGGSTGQVLSTLAPSGVWAPLDLFTASFGRGAGHTSTIPASSTTHSGRSAGSNAAVLLVELAAEVGPVTPEATAALTITTGGTATLDGTQPLVATATVTTSGTATLHGTVPASAVATVTTGGSAILDETTPGVVEAAATATVTTSGTAVLAGTQPLTATATITTGGEAVLTDAGDDLGATLTITTGGTATLTEATGALWAEATATITTGGQTVLDSHAGASITADITTGGTATLSRHWPRSPYTGRAAYTLTVAHRDGTPLATLGAGLEITAPIRTRIGDVDGTGTGTTFQIPADSPDADGVRQFREVQIHRAGHHLETCVLLRPEHQGRTGVIDWQAVGLGWYLGKRRIGPHVRPELLTNPSFEDGLTGWRPGWSKPSIPAEPPKVSVVASGVVGGRKALRVEGSTAVKKTVTRLGSDTTFAPGSSVLSSEGKTALREFARQVEVDRDPDDLVDIEPPVIRIEGHTDDVPDYGPGGNQGLSERRAKAVRDFLAPLVPDGTTLTWVGYGDTRPIVPNHPDTYTGTPANRRVDIVYPKVESARGHRQYVGQALRYTNPSAHIKRNLTLVAYGTLESYKEPNLDGAVLWLGRRLPGDKTYAETAMARIDEETPLGTPTRWECSITVPADGREWEIVARLKPPAGTVVYDACSLKADDALEFINVDYSTIVKGLIAHAQDPAYGKDDLHLTADVRPTGHRTSRVYYWHERETIASCLAELAAHADGPDIDIDSVTRTVRARRRIGQDTIIALATSNGVLDEATVSLDGDSAATAVIVQADGSGADREEGVAIGTTDDVDLVLEDVYTAEPGTRVGELDAQAARYHALVAGHNPLVVLTADADHTDMLLDAVGRGDTVDVDVPSPLHHVTGRARIPGWSLDTGTDRLTYAPELLEV